MKKITFTCQKFGPRCQALAFSPDGESLASADADGFVTLWDVNNGHKIANFIDKSMRKKDRTPVNTVAFSPDGHIIASGHEALFQNADKAVKLWEVATGKLLLNFKGYVVPLSASAPPHAVIPVNSIVFSPGGQDLAIGNSDGTITILELKTQTPKLILYSQARTIHSIAFSPDGKILASEGRGVAIKLWDTETGQELKTLKGHKVEIFSLAFSPDGTTLASSSYDHTIKLWDVEIGKELVTLLGHTESVLSVAFSTDGQLLVSGSADGTIRLWDVLNENLLMTIPSNSEIPAPISCVVFSPKTYKLATASDNITVWEFEVSEV
jgi:WD40 repeat protein